MLCAIMEFCPAVAVPVLHSIAPLPAAAAQDAKAAIDRDECFDVASRF